MVDGVSRRKAAKKTTAKKTAPKKTTAKKTAPKKTAAKKSAPKKTTAKKTAPKKTAAPKATAKKTAAKKTAAKKGAAVEGVEAGGAAAESIAAAWAAAEKKLQKAGIEELPKGASERAIQEAEKALGVQFPEDFRAFYRLHDGGGGNACIFEGWELLSLEGIVAQWKIWKGLVDEDAFEGMKSRPAPGVKDDWWNPRWIPFTYDGAGNHHCLDLDPARGGRPGQVILMWHDDDERPVVAKSLAALLEKVEWGEPE